MIVPLFVSNDSNENVELSKIELNDIPAPQAEPLDENPPDEELDGPAETE